MQSLSITQIPSNLPHRLYSLGTPSVPAKQDVEVGKIRVDQPIVETLDLGRRGPTACALLVCCVVAEVDGVDCGDIVAEGLEDEGDELVADVAGRVGGLGSV